MTNKMYWSFLIYGLVLSSKALFVKTFYMDDPDYHLHGRSTNVTYPYHTLTGDNNFCRSKCLNDDLCNGYSIDTSSNGCFLSRCTNYTSVPTCTSCFFASKKTTKSTEYCLPASTTAQMTTTTHTTTTTTLPTTTPGATMMSTEIMTPIETATTSETMTPLDAAISIERIASIETATASETMTPLDSATSTETMTHIENAISTETTTPVDAATSTETTTLVETATTSDTMTPIETDTFTETMTTIIFSASPIVINNTTCYCACREVNQNLKYSIEERRVKLTINKRELSSNIKKLYSVTDYRMSSKMIGSVAIITLIVAGILIILADLSFIFSSYSKRKSKKKKKKVR